MAKRGNTQPRVKKTKSSSAKSQPALSAFKKKAGPRSGGSQPKF